MWQISYPPANGAIFSYIFQNIHAYLPLVAGRQPEEKRPLPLKFPDNLEDFKVTKKQCEGLQPKKHCLNKPISPFLGQTVKFATSVLTLLAGG